jgi:hypothetical protein
MESTFLTGNSLLDQPIPSQLRKSRHPQHQQHARIRLQRLRIYVRQIRGRLERLLHLLRRRTRASRKVSGAN